MMNLKKIILRNPATRKCFIDIMHVYKSAQNAMNLCRLIQRIYCVSHKYYIVTAFTFKQFYFHVTMTIFGRKYLDQYLSRITGIFEIKIQLP